MGVFNDPKNGLSTIPENIHSTKEENWKKKKYLFDCLKSDKYKERLTKEMEGASEKEIQAEINKRIQNLKNIGVEVVKDPISPGGWGGTLGIYWPSELTKEELQRGVKPSHIQLEPHSLKSHKNINLEEYSHALEGGTKGGERITEKTKKLIESVTITPSERMYGSGVDPYEKYITTPTEFTAQIQSVRYNMKEKGIYDPLTEDFTEKHFKELMNNSDLKKDTHFERLWDSLEGDENQKKKSFIKVMNEIAAIEPQDNDTMFAKDIGKEDYMAPQMQLRV